ncbi:MAG: aminotransferase class V-fold PLP-dependent enzyme, partial [Gammaproteobacteria bacterium]
RVLAFVHAETSTGAISDAKTLAGLAHQHDCLVIADTVTSLAGSPLEVDAWELDAVYSGTQKCLSCVPGLSPVTFSQRAVDVVTSRKHKVQSWFLDLNLVLGYWGGGGKRSYHHTAPVNTLYGLHEALVILQEEGIENSWARHRKNHEALREGFEAMGLKFVVPADERLPQLNAVSVPDGVDEAAVRSALLAEYNLEIGAGLGAMAGKIWRVGLMGFASNQTNVLFCLGALDAVLSGMKAPITSGVAVDAARSVFG